MNKHLFNLAALFVFLTLGGAGCGFFGQAPGQQLPANVNKITQPAENQQAPATTSPGANTQENSAAAGQNAAQQASQPAKIDIQNFSFSPAAMTIKEGEAVVWSNDDSVPHQIVSDAGSGLSFQSSVLYTGQSFNVTFTQKGTFGYHCQIHPSMTGTITVE